MLEGLDKVDWASLEDALGPATGVPERIRALASPDAQVREAAVNWLASHVWHQNSVYEVTPHVVPFLVELLGSGSVQGKDRILMLLSLIADGLPWLHESMDWLRPVLAKQGRDFEREVRLAAEHAARGRAAVREHMSLYEGFLDDPDPQTRAEAVTLLCAFLEDRDHVEPLIRRLQAVERDPGVQEAITYGLAYLTEEESEEE